VDRRNDGSSVSVDSDTSVHGSRSEAAHELGMRLVLIFH
jgi:hypothetical protein